MDIRPDRSSFALVLLDGETHKSMIVPASQIVRTLIELEPDVIAIDDLSEFGDSLTRIASATGAKIVRAGKRGKKVWSVAKELGIRTGGHPSPIQTAYLSAKLASLGVYETIFHGVRETIIKISPERSSYRGGREGKYKRALRSFVEHAKEDVERALKEAGIEYDEYHRGMSYEIRAYENVYRIRETLKNVDLQDVRLEVRASKPMRTSLRGKFIVGIDPGTHVGLAFLNIYGELVHSTTLEGGRESVISYIRSVGDPILIAVDVPELPDFVKRVATALRAPVYVPEGPISVEEKREIATEYDLKGSPHERDALAAAVKAYYKYKPKIDRAIREAKNFGVPPEEVVYLVLRNYSVVGAISRLLGPKEEIREEKRRRRERSIEELEKEISQLREELRRLKKAYKAAIEKIEEYEMEIELLKYDAHKSVLEDLIVKNQQEKIAALEREVEKLRSRVDELESILSEISREAPKSLDSLAIGKYFDEATRREISSSDLVSIEEGDVVFIRRPKFDHRGIKELSKARYILVPKEHVRSFEREFEVRIIPRNYVRRKRLGNLVIFDRISLEEALKKVDKEEQKRVEEVFKNIIYELSKRPSIGA